jgi:hypothetical protein
MHTVLPHLAPYHWLLWIFLAGLFSLSSTPATAALRAVLDRDHIMVGETTSLKVIIEEGQVDGVEPFPSIPGLTIRYAGPTRQVSIINGRTSSSITLNYTVQAQREGNYIFPSIKVSAGGQALQTPQVRLTVSRHSPEAGVQEAFAKLIVPKTNLFVGEVIPVEIQLFVTQANQLQIPTLNNDGFIVQKQAPYTQSQTQIGNIIYNVISFKSAVSAAKAGNLTLGPAELSFNLLIRQRNLNDPFGDFFGPNFVRRPITVKTEEYRMHVAPLPATNVPPGFSGAIGSFAFTVDASPLQLTAGDPLTLKLTISGKGNLEAIQMPRFNWPGFKFYEPQAIVTSNDPLAMQGTKTFEQVIIPQHADISEIPPIHFSFFDPAQGQYRTLTRAALPLVVKAAPGNSSPLSSDQKPSVLAEPSTPRDIVHIKQSPGPFLTITPPLLAQPTFLLLQLIPVAALLAAFLYRKRTDWLANNPRLRRKTETRKMVAHGLSDLERLAAEKRTDDFYALLFRLLQEQLGERLNVPASAITEAVLDSELPRKNVPPVLIAALHQLFQECNQARYAPGGPGGHLESLLPNVRSSLQSLQTLPD